jgi:4-amino-4-deoxy-L-arabinose transferase-like glycosyltransferase
MEKSKPQRRWWPLFAAFAVAVIIIAAVVWSRAHPHGIHWDEAEYLDQVGVDVQRLWAGKLLSLGGRLLVKTYGRPPAYRILVLPFLAVFGFHVLVARLVSLGCFALSSWFTYLATRRIAGRTAGAFAVLVFALSPEVVSASIFFGTDASLYLATSAMLYFTFTAWSEGEDRSKTWIGLGFAIGLGLLAKTSFIAIALPVLLFWWIAGHYKYLGIPSLKAQMKAGGLAFLIAAPWWLLNIRSSVAFVLFARGDVRNSLGAPSLGTWMQWLDTVVQCLLGHGLAILIGLVLAISLVKAMVGKGELLDRLQKAGLIACVCAGAPIVLAQLSGTNHLLRHISAAMIPLAVCVGVLAEESGWARSWMGAAASLILICGQMIMLVTPVVFPNNRPVDLAFQNGTLPWQAMGSFDQWDWTPLRTISESCGLNTPKIAYLGNGRAFDMPQIQYAWISKGLAQPEVIWLWRFESGPLDWQKIMDAADQNDIVITAPGFTGEAKVQENVDNEHNAEFADRLSRDPAFRSPTQLALGRFKPVDVVVFVKKSLKCSTETGLSAGK